MAPLTADQVDHVRLFRGTYAPEDLVVLVDGEPVPRCCVCDSPLEAGQSEALVRTKVGHSMSAHGTCAARIDPRSDIASAALRVLIFQYIGELHNPEWLRCEACGSGTYDAALYDEHTEACRMLWSLTDSDTFRAFGGDDLLPPKPEPITPISDWGHPKLR